MAINTTALDALKAKGFTEDQIRQQISTKYGDNSQELLQYNNYVTPSNNPGNSSITNIGNAGSNIRTSKPQVTTTNMDGTTVTTNNKKNVPAKVVGTQVPAGWDTETYNNFKKANPNLEPNAEDTRRMLNAGSGIDTNSLMGQNEDQLVQSKLNTITSTKNKDVQSKQDEFNKGAAVLNSNNKAILNLYGIDENGNIDRTNVNGFANQIDKARQDFETKKNDIMKGFEGTRLNQVGGQIRASLASRGVDISKIPQEQLIALSGDVGNKAFTDIYTAKQETINAIQTNKTDAENKIADLRTKGLISANDAKTNIEMLRAKTTADINEINKQFAKDIFGTVETAKANKTTKQNDALNAITKFGESLGLTGTKLASIQSYMKKYPTAYEVVNAMLADLGNPNSDLKKNVLTVEEANKAAAALKNQIDLAGVNAKITSANAAASNAVTNANKANSTTATEAKYSAAQQTGIQQIIPGSNITTPSQLMAVWGTLTPSQQKDVNAALGQPGQQYSTTTNAGPTTNKKVANPDMAFAKDRLKAVGKTYTYINNDGTIRRGTVGDNYKDTTKTINVSDYFKNNNIKRIEVKKDGTYSYYNNDGTVHNGKVGDNYKDTTKDQPIISLFNKNGYPQL